MIFNQLYEWGQHSHAAVITVASQQEGPGFESIPFCVEFACSLCAWVLPRYSSFLSHSVDMHGFRLTAESKLPVRVNGCLALCVSCAIDW